ncbi:hypothetical protein HMI54_007863 [Coelomomyces lativittatus]|nr:hypothetical protein HMI54_007863 [Coelomomyces lativittatus]
MGATNRPDALDSALRRAGRFDREISMGVPDEAARERMLQVLSRRLRLSGDFDYKAIARLTPGYVGADLKALISEAGMIALKRIFQTMSQSEKAVTPSPIGQPVSISTSSPSPTKLPPMDAQPKFLSSLTSFSNKTIVQFLQKYPSPLTNEELAPLFISQQDFLDSLKLVQPSSKREGFATVPDVTWDQIGALAHIREELRLSIIEPVLHPEAFRQMGITTPSGVLLWGPPGCGKTLLAKAVANESHMNFISVKGPELLNKYVGESERAVRVVFERARASSPCVIFFDEIDALVPRRDDSKSEATSRVVNTVLTELDGMVSRAHIFVIAATNRPDMLDPAILRPGRLDKILYVELPTCQERYDILMTLTRCTPLHSLSMKQVAEWTENFSGADLAALVKESSLVALKAIFKTRNADIPWVLPEVTMEHVKIALHKMKPSVGEAERNAYNRLRDKLLGSGT